MSVNPTPPVGQRIGLLGPCGSGKSTCVVLLTRALARKDFLDSLEPPPRNVPHEKQ